ncbi:BTAD domain-containing putative transcriptional regulator [Pelagicoccus mobilis]|uniref:Bacterial transcriptional activator domain-containing protein n=1 Tax=Pelagicoccus mobilis TaxID=415221 RepID=A0A934S0T3_9BACT|nr:BTAD domain-containing putative transcriptional regulator [Pelagicoccus mobilis]MBK1880241.1 hypothetical protein [Pelagicoccus mobilis]
MLPRNTQSLEIQLLSNVAVMHGNEPIPAFSKPRLQSLLAYLVLHRGKPQARNQIAFSLWPDSEEKQALTNLRQTLHQLKGAIPDADSYLTIETQSIAWKQEAPCTIDVEELENALALAKSADRTTDKKIHALQQASKLYQGDLLPIHDEEWIIPRRNSLRSEFESSQRELITALAQRERYQEASEVARQQVRRDNLSEAKHHTLIDLLAQSGDRSSALLAYNDCAKILEEELGIEPGNELQKLRSQILSQISSTAKTPNRAKAVPSNEVRSSPNRRILPIFSVLAIATACLLVFVFFSQPQASEELRENSIAILPFENRSQLDEDLHFTNGIHDDLITRVSHIQNLKTISRTSVERYRGTTRDLREIGSELGVSTIIEGGVQRSGDQIRINIQLINAQTGYHIWAENYTRELTAPELFALQTEITESIAKELKTVLSLTGKEKLDTLPTRNLAALEAYFRGNQEYDKYTAESFVKARVHYERAVQLDPDFALAHASLAKNYLCELHYAGLPFEEQTIKSDKSIRTALELDPNSSEAYTALSVLRKFQHDVQGAEIAAQKSLKLNPNNAIALRNYAILKVWSIGDLEGAIPLCNRAMELDPFPAHEKQVIAGIHILAGDLKRAHDIIERLNQEEPNNPQTLLVLGNLYGKGYQKYDQAIKYFRLAHSISPDDHNFTWALAEHFSEIGDQDSFLFWARRTLKLSPVSNRANYVKGCIHQALGEEDQAYAYFASMEKTDEYFEYAQNKISHKEAANGLRKISLERFQKRFPSIFQKETTLNLNNYPHAIEYAHLLDFWGETAKAQTLASQIIEYLSKIPRLGPSGYMYKDAELHLILGTPDRALASVREYVEKGGIAASLLNNERLSPLHNSPEFQELTTTVQSRLTEQRENLEEWERKGKLADIPKLQVTISQRQ